MTRRTTYDRIAMSHTLTISLGVRSLGKKLLPAFLLRDYTPYECKVGANKENYNWRGRLVHMQNIVKTMVNTKKLAFLKPVECTNCLFSTRQPNIYITAEGICNMCWAYRRNFKPDNLRRELTEFLAKPRLPDCKHDALVAYSGGKDSTLSLTIAVQDLGMKVVAVLVDPGFIPAPVKEQAERICARLDVPLRIEHYDLAPKLREMFDADFANGYPCYYCTGRFHDMLLQVCVRERINRVVLGRNWWRTLDPVCSGIRKIQPAGATWEIDLISLPFVMRIKEEHIRPYLERVGWQPTRVHGNSTNCLVPGLVEKIVRDRIGYHPELNLLSREVITGFISKEKAIAKLATIKDQRQLLGTILEQKLRGTGDARASERSCMP